MDFISILFWLTLNVYHEARGEDQIDQIAVAHVTLNRARKENETVKEVVLKPYQFSWVHTQPWMPKELPALIECFQSSVIAISGFDFTGGATHYHEKRVKPYWAKSKYRINTFGAHHFYTDIKLLKATKFKRMVPLGPKGKKKSKEKIIAKK